VKTTAKHFDIFKRECRYWIRRFGLLDWNIDYSHDLSSGGYKATCTTQLDDRTAMISLSIDWLDNEPTVINIKLVAFHEVCELLLARFDFIAKARYLQLEDVDEERHSIIARLQNAFLGEV